MHNVVVTGGSRGLGLAIASSLASSGYSVIAVARTETQQLKNAVAAVQKAGRGSLQFGRLDLGDTSSIPGFVSALRREVGPIYGLVNNAGLGTAGVLAIMRDQDIEKLVRINTIAPLILSKYIVRSMFAQRAGRIVNVASVVALTGYSGLSAYSATKSALVGFTRSLAREVGRLGITVNAVAPGFADTEMTQDLGEGERERIVRRSALKRLIEPGDVAAAVLYLMSDTAKNVTGVTLPVDAGNTA